jgi:glycogen(starch) synthase
MEFQVMHVFMLGWEFPPFMSGGLGTACLGLTKALGKRHTSISFVMPQALDQTQMRSAHLTLLSAQESSNVQTQGSWVDSPRSGSPRVPSTAPASSTPIRFEYVQSAITSPYQFVEMRELNEQPKGIDQPEIQQQSSVQEQSLPGLTQKPTPQAPVRSPYQGNLLAEASRYADRCVKIAQRADTGHFDVIHAHDWLTFPAGLAVSRATGRPLVVHIHSTEFDRCPEQINQAIFDIERRGMHGAMQVVCVSHLTQSVVQHRYGVDPSKIKVIYNGIDAEPTPALKPSAISPNEKIVLFLGRITAQKGPSYFLQAARRVLEKDDQVKFVVAGSGDQVQSMMQATREYGIEDKVIFTGFLHGSDVEQVFRMADVYVMPSVSEPFGIAPLEAISHDVPVIISRTSGVAEVLTHALKVDFWDIDEMANKIIAVLRHPPLARTLRRHADMEIRQLTWDGAAVKCLKVYRQAMDSMESGRRPKASPETHSVDGPESPEIPL